MARVAWSLRSETSMTMAGDAEPNAAEQGEKNNEQRVNKAQYPRPKIPRPKIQRADMWRVAHGRQSGSPVTDSNNDL